MPQAAVAVVAVPKAPASITRLSTDRRRMSCLNTHLRSCAKHRFLAERVDPPLHKTLRLQRSSCTDYEKWKTDEAGWGEDEPPWSPYGICEALAHKNKWRNARGGRLDVFRAANWLLRAALRGQIGLSAAYWPPEDLPDIDAVMADGHLGVQAAQ